MKRLVPIALGSLFLLTGLTGAHAQEVSDDIKLRAGTQEVLIDGNIDPDGVLGTSIDIGIGYGYFFADYMEIGIRLDLQDNDAFSSYTFGVFGEYNFETLTNMIPIVGGELGYTSLDAGFQGSEAGLLASVYGGTKFYITDYLAFSGTLNLSFSSDDVFQTDDGADNVDIELRFGVRAFF